MAGSDWHDRWGRHDSDDLSRQRGCEKVGSAHRGDACLMPAKLKTAVLGATGYSGLELTRILLRHPRVEKPALLRRQSDADVSPNLAEIFPALSGNGSYPLQPLSWQVLKQQGIELLFLATPHEASRALVPDAIAQGLRVIDLSGAWRLKREH